MSGYRYIPRTNSTLRRLQKLRDFEVEFIVKDTATLVSAYNEARASHKHHEELLLWIGNYIPFFEKQTTSECSHDVMEFAQLAKIIVKGPGEIRLLEDAFNVLCRKIHWGDYGEAKIIEAFNYFLLFVDCKVFAGNPHPLTKIARDVLKKLGPEQTFSRGTYPTHCISLLALYHLCAVINQVDPTEFDHNRKEGLYQEMSRCLQNIIDSQSYYPFYYQATLTQQSLSSMDSSTNVSSKEIWYRLFCAMKGTAYFFQALSGALSMSVDIDSLENGVKQWTEACTSHLIKQNSWYECVQRLIDSRMLVQHDSEKLGILEECFVRVDDIQDETESEENRKALRFAMIDEVARLALDHEDQSVKEWAVEKFSYFAKCCAPQIRWAQDLDILEALVSGVFGVRQRFKSRLDLETVTQTIRFHVRSEKHAELIDYWKQEVQWRGEDKATSTSKDIGRCESLFSKIRKKMLLNESLPTRLATRHALKEHYQQRSEV